MLNVLITEDNYESNISLSNYISHIPSLKVAHLALNGQETIDILFKFKIDILLLDLCLPDINGVDILNIISRNHHIFNNLQIIIVSSSNEHIDKCMEYYGLINKVFTKPLEFECFTNFMSSLANGSSNINDNIEIISNDLIFLSFNFNNQGTTYLLEAICENQKNTFKDITSLYNHIGHKFGVKTNLIKWSINNSINNTLFLHGEKKINLFFKIFDNRKITAKNIINFYKLK